MTQLVQDLHATELEQQHNELTLFQTSQKRGFVLPGMMKSEWAELMNELQIVQTSFTRMLFADQLKAVRDFEIATRVEQRMGEAGELEPTDIEYVKKHFPEPFLGSTFCWLWKDIVAAGLESFAIIEIKKVSVDKILVSSIREDRLPWNRLFAVTSQLHDRYDVCEICHEPAQVTFLQCWFCKDSPS